MDNQNREKAVSKACQYMGLEAVGTVKRSRNIFYCMHPEETLDCPNCGQHTMTGRRAKSNGHFHGRCTRCGTRVINQEVGRWRTERKAGRGGTRH